MVTKAVKEFTDASGRRKVKGSMDVELAVDAMELAGQIDQMVLFSGDGAFRSLVEAVQRRGVRVTVISTISSQPPMIADELRRQADVFTDLAELRSKLSRDPSGRPDSSSPIRRRQVIEQLMTTCCRRPGRCRRHRHPAPELLVQPKKPLATAFTNTGSDSTSRPPKIAWSARRKAIQNTDAATIASLAQHASDDLMIA